MVFFFQPVFDDPSLLAEDRKVTFDVSESDISSTTEPPHSTGDHKHNQDMD